MTEKDNYFLHLKTSQAEVRAWRKISAEDKTKITPILEISKGRQKRRKNNEGPKIYDFGKILDDIVEDFSNGSNQLIVDIDVDDIESIETKDKESNEELTKYISPDNGYQGWTDLLNKIESSFQENNRNHNFPNIIPNLLCNPKGDPNEHYMSIRKQFRRLARKFSCIAYRVPVEDIHFINDLKALKEDINGYTDSGKTFYLILDHQHVTPHNVEIRASNTIKLIAETRYIINFPKIVILASSFPRSVTDIGGDTYGEIRNEEVHLYDRVARLNQGNPPLIYGDYGSIYAGNVDTYWARGWRARVDFPTSKKITFYHRSKGIYSKSGSGVASYINIAGKVFGDDNFDGESLNNSWGVEQIKAAANGNVPGRTPSFWISVRFEIHVKQQLKRLGL